MVLWPPEIGLGSLAMADFRMFVTHNHRLLKTLQESEIHSLSFKKRKKERKKESQTVGPSGLSGTDKMETSKS